MTSTPRPLRIGVLGAARIVKGALVEPARAVSGVEVHAIAARDVVRAGEYATRHGIAVVRSDYEQLLADPDVEAVYVPLPAALHARWTIAAIDAGKHVLVEKPFTSNAIAAEAVAARADRTDSIVMEAYHSGYHPLHRRLAEIIDSGEMGTPQTAHATFGAAIPPGRDIRWNLALGGGGLLDVGYYPVRLLRELFGATPDVRAARAWTRGAIDRLVIAELDFASGVRARVVSGMWSRHVGMGLTVTGTQGTMRVSFPYHPQVGARIRIRGANGRRIESTTRRSSYEYQLEAFRNAIHGRKEIRSDPWAAVEQLRTIDAIYIVAGLAPRP